MTCPHCGTRNIPDGSAVCPACGHELAAAPAAAEHPVAPAPAERKPYLLAGILGAVVVILLVALFLMSRPKSLVTQAPAQQAPPPGPAVTQAPAPQAPAVPPPGPAVTQAPAAQPPTVNLPKPDPMKAAIQAYLQRVGQIESQRQAVVNNLVPALVMAQVLQAGGGENDMLKELLNPDPDVWAQASQEATQHKPNDVQKLISGYVGQLRALDSQLRAIQPVPRPAFDFARAYDSAFAAYAGSMVQIGQLLNQGLENQDQASAVAGQLNALKGPWQTQAQTGLRTADAQLAQLCQQYGIPKPFDITDNPAGTVTGM